MRLRKFRFSGFKALDGATFHIPDRALLLIGGNGSGKSSTLQALAMVQDFARGNAAKFLDDRAWSYSGVRSQLEGSRATTFRADLTFGTEAGDSYLWQFDFGLRSGRNLRETLWHLPPESLDPSLKVDHRQNTTTLHLSGTTEFKGFRLPGSVLAFYDLDAQGEDAAGLRDIVEWGRNITSLELLSPTAMRRGARGSTRDIGPRGERLASFLASLSHTAKDNLVRRLSAFYPIREILTTRKRAGWVDMRIAEEFSHLGAIGPLHASDGLLRLMALCAIPEFSPPASLVLLDEIEDGVEPHILPDIIRQIVSDSRSQFAFTSHSPILVNSFRPAEIQLLTRQASGSVATSRFSDLDCWAEGIDYFGPGELWNMAERDALRQHVIGLADSAVDRARPATNRFSRQHAVAFMTEGPV